MSRPYKDDNDTESYEEDENADVDEEDSDVEFGGKTKRRRSKSNSVDDDDDGYGGGNGRRRGAKRHRNSVSDYFEVEAIHASDEEEDDDDLDDFIDTGADIPVEYEANDRQARRPQLHPLIEDEQEEDVEEIERRIHERYSKNTLNTDYDDHETTYVDHQAQLPSVMGPKLWLIKCEIGHERKVAFCLMQKYIDKAGELKITSAVAIDHIKGYVYVEAYKEAHVREAIKGMGSIFPKKIMLVPIKEMTDVLSVSAAESKAIDVCIDSWVRVKIGIYKGDLAKVVRVDDVKRRATVKLIPRVDLQALVNKLEGRQVPKKTAYTPPARFINIDEVRDLHIHVEHKRDKVTGDYFDKFEGMMFRGGFLYKTLSLKSLATHNVEPTYDELEKFRQPAENEDDESTLSILCANRKKNHFVKGDRVIVVEGDLTNLKGWVEKVDENIINIKTNEQGLPKTLTFREKELCKCFEPGNHVKVVSGAAEGASGLVVSVEGHLVNIMSDVTKELHRVFADNVVETSEAASVVTNIRSDYEIHDLVLLNDNSFGVIIRAEGKAFQVLKGVSKRPEIAIVKSRDIKCKIFKNGLAKDRYMKPLSVKDVVRILDGPSMGKQGPVKHIYRDTLFISDCQQLGHGGFICIKSESCRIVGGSRENGDRNIDTMTSRFAHLRTAPCVQSHMGPRRGRDALVGTAVKICRGNYKGHKGRVVLVKGSIVRVELESQMKVVAVDRSYISDNVSGSTSFRETSRYGTGSETPMRPCRTPLRSFTTDSCATPPHDGMRTPMRNRAWNPSISYSTCRL